MLKPFATSIWYNLIFTILLASALMSFIFRWDLRLSRASNASMALQGDSTILTTIGFYCQQGAGRLPWLTSGRSLLICLCLSSIMMYNFYTADLVSGLVASSSQTNIKTITDLANSKLKIGFVNTPYIGIFINVCDAPIRQFIFRN